MSRRASIRFRFGLAGWIYVLVTLFLTIGAFNSQNNLMFWASGAAFSILLVSGMINNAMLFGAEVERAPVGDAQVGRPLVIRYRFRNTRRWLASFAVSVEELGVRHAGKRRRRWRRARAVDAPGSGDRWWSGDAFAFVAHVSPRGRSWCEARVVPLRRGSFRLEGYDVSSRFPFGILRRSLRLLRPAEVVVTPRPAPVEAEVFRAGSRDQAPGRNASRLIGGADEYYALREYMPGDSIRRIAWRASARRDDELLVREHVAPEPRLAWVVLSLSPARDDERDELAIERAAGVIVEGDRLGRRIGLAIPGAGGGEGVLRTPGLGSRHRQGLLRELGRLDLASVDRTRVGHVPESVTRSGTRPIIVSGAGVRAQTTPEPTPRGRPRSPGEGAVR